MTRSAQKIWLAGLGAFARARTEGDKLFDLLAEQGKGIRAKTEDGGGDMLYVQGHSAPGIYARAFLEGRDFVIPEDVQDTAPSVGAHRLILRGENDGLDKEEIVRAILSDIPVPLL